MMNPLLLVILDGFGARDRTEGNAIALARMPHYQKLLATYPHTNLAASGEAVGLPKVVMGNSEVGHLTIGAGRIVFQDLTRINRSIDDGSFFKNRVLTEAMQKTTTNDKTVHLMGLLSDGGVHSHEKHLFALFKLAREQKVKKIVVHCFLDGRDTPPKSSQNYIRSLQREMKENGIGEIGTLIGRYYAMDRDKRWERVQIAYDALVEGKGENHSDPIRAVEEVYQKHLTDEFIKPIVFGKNNRITDGDSVIFFNFRSDRARELTRSLTESSLKLASFVCLTEYDKTFNLPVAFPPEKPKRILAEILSENGIPQFHTAETEKYAHVTYFLNGGVETPFPLEERLLIPSPRDVPTYDKKPEMHAGQVTEEALKRIRGGVPVVIMNYANPDMVGHSGDLKATIKAVEVIDDCIGKLSKEILARDGTMIITADHGNCEEMQDAKGGPHTAHTNNPVPLVLIGERWETTKLRGGGGLQDVTPTILSLLEIPLPAEMTGESLIVES